MAWSERKQLPEERRATTYEFRFEPFGEVKITTGFYDANQRVEVNNGLGEVFIEMDQRTQEGVELKKSLTTGAHTLSVGLQYGIPIEELLSEKGRDIVGHSSAFGVREKSLVQYINSYLIKIFGNKPDDVPQRRTT